MTLYFKIGKTAYKITPKKYPKLTSYLASKKDDIKKMYDDWVKDPVEFIFPRLILYDANGYEVLMKELKIKERVLAIYANTTDEKNKVVDIYAQGFWNDILYAKDFPEDAKKLASQKEIEMIAKNLKIVKN